MPPAGWLSIESCSRGRPPARPISLLALANAFRVFREAGPVVRQRVLVKLAFGLHPAQPVGVRLGLFLVT